MSSKRTKKIGKEIRNVVCYFRVSTPNQAIEGNSLVVQDNVCKKYAADKHLNIVKVFTEEGESAKTVDRTRLKEMISFCKASYKEVDAILIYKVDRLARNTTDYLTLKGYFSVLGTVNYEIEKISLSW